MKILSVLLFISGVTFASGVRGQKVDVSIQDGVVLDVIEEIEKQCDFRFAYSPKFVDMDKQVNIDVHQTEVTEVLDEVLKNTDLTYMIDGDVVVLRPRALGNDDVKQQKGIVTGTVTDTNGDPIPGVSILIKGTTIGIISDFDGNYTLSGVANDAVLVFSFVGMRTQEIPVAGKTTFNVVMEADAIGIEEVVAIGYGSVKKRDITGSVKSIKPEDLGSTPVVSVDQMLQGNMSGVRVVQGSGEPGAGVSVQIRGGNSLMGNNEPLYVIDGFPIDNSQDQLQQGDGLAQQAQNPLATIDPNDIESVEVLKDASATAIYGARGANGVILITTKRGKKGRMNVSFNSMANVSQIGKKIDVLSGKEYAEYINEAYLNDGKSIKYNGDTLMSDGVPVLDPDGNVIIPAPSPENIVGRNWQDEIYRTAFSQKHSLSINGATDKVQYAFAGTWDDQEGILKNSSFKRGNIRSNINAMVHEKVKVGANLNATRSESSLGQTNDGSGSGSNYSTILKTITYRPLEGKYNAEGEYDEGLNNPIGMVNTPENQRVVRVIGSAFGELEVMPGLMYKLNAGTDYSNSSRDKYWKRDTWLGANNNGKGMHLNTEKTSYLVENLLTFSKEFNKAHRVNAVAGYTYQTFKYIRSFVQASNFEDDILGYWGLQSGTTYSAPVYTATSATLSSYLLRVNYAFRDRYLLTFSGRADGSSRFGDNNKWGYFPSAAFGWRAMEEPFIKNLNLFSNLKFRLSYGQTGNQAIPSYGTLALISSSNTPFSGTLVSGSKVSSMENANLKWETTTQSNVGIDMAFLENRVRLTMDYYAKSTKDLLQRFQLPTSSGFENIWLNRGEIENTGYEFELAADIISKKVLKWNMSGNISINRNKIIDLGIEPNEQGHEQFFSQKIHSSSGLKSPAHVNRVGEPVGMFYGYKTDGVYQNQQDVEEGVEPSKIPGMIRIANLDNDENIDEDDKTILGNPNPDFIFGLTNSFKIKNIDFQFLITGSIGGDILNANLNWWEDLRGLNNITKEAYDGRWTGEGSSNYYPIASSLNPGNIMTDRLIEDGTYIRLKNIEMGYKIPVRNIKAIRNARIHVNVTNPFIWTSYKGYDPDVNSFPYDNLRPGVDNNAYPTATVYSMGVKVNF